MIVLDARREIWDVQTSLVTEPGNWLVTVERIAARFDSVSVEAEIRTVFVDQAYRCAAHRLAHHRNDMNVVWIKVSRSFLEAFGKTPGDFR